MVYSRDPTAGEGIPRAEAMTGNLALARPTAVAISAGGGRPPYATPARFLRTRDEAPSVIVSPARRI
ncbi:hypothetical protein GCM10010449_32840 [Streptomyces rectiviolaceus]|uniref:Uncharacterized protein n=1 Tax=Streptomyces rectiviolaceus TaxID=332591 RepID=A0ABP6MGN3_9ACTN